MTPITKICKACEIDKPIKDYFVAVKGKHLRYHPRCKPCHNLFNNANYKPRVKKLSGFAALPREVRDDILKMVSEKCKWNAIAKKHSIVYSTLCYWKNNGFVCEPNNIVNI
jgi:transposase-like protein